MFLMMDREQREQEEATMMPSAGWPGVGNWGSMSGTGDGGHSPSIWGGGGESSSEAAVFTGSRDGDLKR